MKQYNTTLYLLFKLSFSTILHTNTKTSANLTFSKSLAKHLTRMYHTHGGIATEGSYVYLEIYSFTILFHDVSATLSNKNSHFSCR